MWWAQLLNSLVGILSGGGAGVGGGSFESIATASGTGLSGTITFSSIPSTYKSLQVRINCLLVTAGNSINLQFNGDTGANYTRHRLYGNGSTVTADAATALSQAGLTATGGELLYPTAIMSDVVDYASTTKNKTVRTFSGIDTNATGGVHLLSNLWSNTSAITSVTVLSASSFATSTTISLYGIKG